ncbi:hypothetical protein M6B38_367815 [Iris pallida]|uniref:Uncharacterized protein n=1 Tax=Iris pallida TaxID=29817 RepID=A0AAX6GEF6_IRIPA|nr:hypothetical protein M6B38_367815 [Iris pallida]
MLLLWRSAAVVYSCNKAYFYFLFELYILYLYYSVWAGVGVDLNEYTLDSFGVCVWHIKQWNY